VRQVYHRCYKARSAEFAVREISLEQLHVAIARSGRNNNNKG
jgi:hypothetical protein